MNYDASNIFDSQQMPPPPDSVISPAVQRMFCFRYNCFKSPIEQFIAYSTSAYA